MHPRHRGAGSVSQQSGYVAKDVNVGNQLDTGDASAKAPSPRRREPTPRRSVCRRPGCGYRGVCTFRRRSDPFRNQTSDPWVDPLRPGKASRHPNQTGPRPHSDRAPRIFAESIRTLPPCRGVNGMGRRFFLAMAWKGMGARATLIM